ncbi:MAG: hypothetical protein LBO82_04130 [Synergistaceae bacterium]|jgi:hypothetical protein|nr:hypothetical protein [Synergistaceae bacterium]
MQNLSANISISKEIQETFKKELGDAAGKKPPKGMNSDDFIDYLKERYKNSPDGVLFREGGRHRRASVDNGINWISLGERHPSKAVNIFTAEQAVKELDQSRMRFLQARRGEKTLEPKQWSEEVKALGILKNPKIYETPIEQGVYTGGILYRDPAGRYCVQKLGERTLMLHDARKFPEGFPEKGDVVRVSYRAGVAEVTTIRERANKRGGR